MLKPTAKQDFKPMRQACKAETCYEFAVKTVELDGTKRGQKSCPQPTEMGQQL